MLEDMVNQDRIEIAIKHIRRAGQLMRDELNEYVNEGDENDVADPEALLLMDSYTRLLMVLEGMNPVKTEWPKDTDGKDKVVDLMQYKKAKADAVCKGG